MSEDVGTKLKFWADWHGDKETADTFREAIKEIERLRAENERLRKALKPFGLVASIFENDDADRTVSLGRWYPSPILPEPGDFAADIKYTVADFRRASAALAKENK
jgi:hypothetical protein